MKKGEFSCLLQSADSHILDYSFSRLNFQSGMALILILASISIRLDMETAGLSQRFDPVHESEHSGVLPFRSQPKQPSDLVQPPSPFFRDIWYASHLGPGLQSLPIVPSWQSLGHSLPPGMHFFSSQSSFASVASPVSKLRSCLLLGCIEWMAEHFCDLEHLVYVNEPMQHVYGPQKREVRQLFDRVRVNPTCKSFIAAIMHFREPRISEYGRKVRNARRYLTSFNVLLLLWFQSLSSYFSRGCPLWTWSIAMALSMSGL